VRRGRRRKHPQEDLQEKREHWKLKEEALYHTVENSLLEERQKEEETRDEEEDASIYGMTIRKREKIGK